MATLTHPIGCSCAEQCGCSSSSSLPQPPEKKPKLMSPSTIDDDDDENQVEEEKTYESDDDDYMNEEEARLYTKHLLESDGFDVPKFNKTFLVGYIIPFLHWESRIKMYNEYARRALLDYNAKNCTNFELVKIVKVNAQGSGGIMYYITFEVMTMTDFERDAAAEGSSKSKTQIFQARVFVGITDFEVELCRPKPSHTTILHQDN